jgi:hypothetical protein
LAIGVADAFGELPDSIAVWLGVALIDAIEVPFGGAI